MPLLVMKFGGTSVATLDRIKRAAKRVGLEVAKGYDVIVIVSAMSGKTNELVGWVNETSPLYDAREYDAVVSSGENVTAGLMALTLQEMDIPARSWQGWQVPLKTSSSHSAARIEDIPTANILIKRRVIVEHPKHVCSTARVPATNVLVEAVGFAEHLPHIGYVGYIPITDVLVEGGDALEHPCHIRDVARTHGCPCIRTVVQLS